MRSAKTRQVRLGDRQGELDAGVGPAGVQFGRHQIGVDGERIVARQFGAGPPASR